MTQTLEQRLLSFAARHGERGILVDTNVLLLFLFGKFQPALIGKKRLEKYGIEDADLLLQYLARFRYILTTQHVLAETSNLARQIVGGRLLRELGAQLYPLFCMDTPASLRPQGVDTARIDPHLFARLGLTDAGLASLVNADTLLLTDDLDLYLEAVGSGGDAINFTHMREAAGTI